MAEAAQVQPPSQPSPQAPEAKPEKAKKVKVKKEKKPKAPRVSNEVALPMLVEFTYTTAVIIMMVLFVTVIGVSLFTGATLLDTFIRTTVTMVLIGGLLLILARMVSKNALENSIVEYKKLVEEEEEKRKAELEKADQETADLAALGDDQQQNGEFAPRNNRLSEFDFEMMDMEQSGQPGQVEMPAVFEDQASSHIQAEVS